MACKCGKQWMEVRGNRLICQCGLEGEIEQKRPTYDEVISERNKLRQRVKELEQQLKSLLV